MTIRAITFPEGQSVTRLFGEKLVENEEMDCCVMILWQCAIGYQALWIALDGSRRGAYYRVWVRRAGPLFGVDSLEVLSDVNKILLHAKPSVDYLCAEGAY